MSELDTFIQTASAADIRETLDFLLNECTIEDTPTVAEIHQWQTILRQRGGKFAQLADGLCQNFLDEQSI